MSLPNVYADPYPKPAAAELERLKALCECRCERPTVDRLGLCARCGRTRDWSLWIAAA